MDQHQEQEGPRRYLSAAELAQRWGVSAMTLSLRRKSGDMLAPDVVVGRYAGWDAERADAWWESVSHAPGRRRKV